MTNTNEKPKVEYRSGATPPVRQVPVAWEALEDAFENNAPEVHSYLHLDTGEVIRVVDGVADPAMHARIVSDSNYLRVDPVSSREQYRWMERFIVTCEEGEFRTKLMGSIDGKGAFRRFKDVLMNYPVDRERWFVFRSERLKSCMEAWLLAHGIEAIARPQWRVPTADEVRTPGAAAVEPGAEAVINPETPPVQASAETAEPAEEKALPPAIRKVKNSPIAEALRARAKELLEILPARDLDAAVAFLEFLKDRKHIPKPKTKSGDDAEAAES